MKRDISSSIVQPARVLKILLGSILGIVTLHLLGESVPYLLGREKPWGFVEEFALDSENNIPTYFSSLLLLLISVCSGLIARFAWEQRSSFRRHWLGLSLIFFGLSVDEMASLHERVGNYMPHFVETEGIFYFGWVIPGVVFLVLFGVAYLRFFWHLPRRWKVLFAGAGLLYVGGALGLELVGGWYISQYGEWGSVEYLMINTVEEGLEMVGAALFIYALLAYLRAHVAEVRLSFGAVTEGDVVWNGNGRGPRSASSAAVARPATPRPTNR